MDPELLKLITEWAHARDAFRASETYYRRASDAMDVAERALRESLARRGLKPRAAGAAAADSNRPSSVPSSPIAPAPAPAPAAVDSNQTDAGEEVLAQLRAMMPGGGMPGFG